MHTSPDRIERGISIFRTLTAGAFAATLALNLGVASAEAPRGAAPNPQGRGTGADTAHVNGTGMVDARDPARARLERLSEHDVKRLYRACSEESVRRRLGSGEITHCSILYDVLLKQHFAGDFHALLAWSRVPDGLLRQ